MIRDATHRERRLLMAVRAARSVGQGVLMVDFALYLRALGWSGAAIGSILAAGLFLGAALTAVLGPLSDRKGRKPLLLTFEFSQMLAALAAIFSDRPAIIAAAAILGQFGRGGNGAAGPFAAVEQAWLARFVRPEERGEVYSWNSALGFLGLGAGAVLAGIPAGLLAWLPSPLSERALFLPPLAAAFAAFVMLSLVPDRKLSPPPSCRALQEQAGMRRRENGLLLRLLVANLLQGIGIGLAGPLVSYWFATRFGAGPHSIGPMMAVGFFLAALSSFGAGRLVRWFGVVRVVLGMRLVGLVLLLAMPILPSFSLAAAAYAGRSLFNRGTNGARQALSVSLVGPERQGFAGSLSSVSLQLPRALGPVLAGLLFDAGFLAVPFLLAAGFQAAYLWYYGTSFARHEKSILASARSPEQAPARA